MKLLPDASECQWYEEEPPVVSPPPPVLDAHCRLFPRAWNGSEWAWIPCAPDKACGHGRKASSEIGPHSPKPLPRA